MSITLDELKRNVFPGESGGDYNALFGYANRKGGQFSDTRLTDMTVDQALAFANPSGPYGQSVKGQIGRVATPMGAYQVVGTTLNAAKKGLGLTGSERMTPELQDRIGMWIYQNQGPQAWVGWGKGGGAPAISTQNRGGALMAPAQQPTGLLDMLGIQKRDPAAGGEAALPFYQRDRFGNVMDALALGLSGMSMHPNQAIVQMAAGRMAERKQKRADNKTVEMLQRIGADPKLIELAKSGYAKEAIGLAYAKPTKTGRVVTAEQLKAMFPGTQIEPGLYNLKDDNTISKVGGGGTTVTVGGAEKAWEKGIGEYGVKTYEGIQSDAMNAQNILSRTAQLEALMSDTNFQSGALADSVAAGKKIIEALGGNPANVGSIEGFKSVASQLVLDSMGGSLGAGFSEGDRKFVQSIQPSLDTSVQGNKLIINMQRAIAQRKLDIAEFADQYVQEFGKIDEKFNAALRKWSEANPLFTPSASGVGSYLE